MILSDAISGAVKSNIGHLEGCSGLAGVIKAILAIERGMIPPNANFEVLNDQIDAEFFNLKVSASHQTVAHRFPIAIVSSHKNRLRGPMVIVSRFEELL